MDAHRQGSIHRGILVWAKPGSLERIMTMPPNKKRNVEKAGDQIPVARFGWIEDSEWFEVSDDDWLDPDSSAGPLDRSSAITSSSATSSSSNLPATTCA